jgi:hypothetical protein
MPLIYTSRLEVVERLPGWRGRPGFFVAFYC